MSAVAHEEPTPPEQVLAGPTVDEDQLSAVGPLGAAVTPFWWFDPFRMSFGIVLFGSVHGDALPGNPLNPHRHAIGISARYPLFQIAWSVKPISGNETAYGPLT